jgi:NADH dehydrogenase FAD-containing subunit
MLDSVPRVVIVGGGFGGLAAAKALRETGARVVLVDRENHHLFQPLLYQVATSVLSPGQIASPTRGILRKQPNATVLLGEVTGVDIDRRCVFVDSVDREGVALEYDYLSNPSLGDTRRDRVRLERRHGHRTCDLAGRDPREGAARSHHARSEGRHAC